MSLNDLLRRTEQATRRDLEHTAHAAGLNEAASLARASAENLRTHGDEDKASACDVLALFLEARAVERLGRCDRCTCCGAAITSHIHAAHCAEGPETGRCDQACAVLELVKS